MREVDGRTAALITRLRCSDRHGPFIDAVEALAKHPRPPAIGNLRLLLVPGVLYREHPETGADGQVLKSMSADLGIPLSTFEADETGRLEANTRRLLDWLEAQGRVASAPTILVSLSKGSTEVWQALDSPRAEKAFRDVDAWVSVSGIPLGTPVLDFLTANRLRHALLSFICRWKGWDPGFLVDYRGGASRHRTLRPGLLERLEIVQVSGFPESRDLVDRRSRRFHRRLAGRGPNDGFAWLEELCALPGRVYPVSGADHYLRQVEQLDELMTRILSVLVDDLNAEPGRAE